MRKLILVLCGIFLLLVSFWTLYYAYAPKAGPIGDGFNNKLVWIQFGAQFISGVSFIFIALNLKTNK